MDASIRFRGLIWLGGLGCALVALLAVSPAARAGVVTDGVPGSPGCPQISDKPNAVAHVDYQGVQHITYCYGPITINPGQNIIRLRPAIDGNHQSLWPQQPGYITRFDPEFVYADGSVPRVDVLHLHHAVWAVNGAPQFAVGEEKTVQQLPRASGSSRSRLTWHLASCANSWSWASDSPFHPSRWSRCGTRTSRSSRTSSRSCVRSCGISR